MFAPQYDSELQDLLRKYNENPGDSDLVAELCYGLNIRSYHDLCIQYARKGLANDPHHPGIYYEMIIASSLDTANILEDILAELQAILEKRNNKRDKATLNNLALVHYFLEQDEVAERILSEIMDDLRANRTTYEILAQLEYTRQNFKGCIDYCEKAIDKPGPSARMIRMKGLCYQELGEEDAAIRSFAFALELEPHFVWACHSIAGLCMEQCDYERAFQYFGMATYINPRDPGNLFLLAEAFMDMDQYDLAIAELNKLLMLHPARRIEAEVHNALGYLWLQKKDYRYAEAHLGQALELEPDLALAYHNMGRLAQEKEDYAEAEARYKMALDHDPGMVESWVEMGFMQFEQGHDDEARESFEQALEVDSFEPQAYLGLSKLSQKEKDHRQQLHFAKKAFELDPGHSEICNNLGIAHECSDDLDEAEEAYLRALEVNEMHSAAANNLGYLYEKKMALHPEDADDYRESAIEAWKQRLEICIAQEKSTKAAVTHLLNLGLSQKEIDALCDDTSD